MPGDSHLFPDTDWLIGNHSDELTPWIPVIAARYLVVVGKQEERNKSIITYTCLVKTAAFAATSGVLASFASCDANRLFLQNVFLLQRSPDTVFIFLWNSVQCFAFEVQTEFCIYSLNMNLV